LRAIVNGKPGYLKFIEGNCDPSNLLVLCLIEVRMNYRNLRELVPVQIYVTNEGMATLGKNGYEGHNPRKK
jgi:hypothetical protein